jgi:hypothetical protein
MVLVYVGSIITSYGLLWFRSTRKEGYGSEGQWFHVTDCKMNYTNEECADMHLIIGEARGNSAEADRF